MARRFPVLLAVFAAGILGFAYSSFTDASSLGPANKRETAKDFAFKDVYGAASRLSDHRGKVVLVNFWATWCGPCRIEIPWFVEFEKTLGPRGFTVIGVSMDEDGWRAVKPYVGEQHINYPILIGTESLAQQFGGINSLPTSVLVDRQGRIALRHVGLVSKQTYEREIVRLLND
jgi:thiol-disulfide isomerase/thioredoxin